MDTSPSWKRNALIAADIFLVGIVVLWLVTWAYSLQESLLLGPSGEIAGYLDATSTPTPIQISEGFTPQAVCLVPDVVELDQSVAEDMLVALGLQPVLTIRQDLSLAKGAVITQDPAGNTRLAPCQGEVILTISMGPPPAPTVQSATPTLTATASPAATHTSFPTDTPTSVPMPASFGRIETTYPLTLAVQASGRVYVEIISDQQLAKVGQNNPHATGKIKVFSSPAGYALGFHESKIELYPYMSALLLAPDFVLSSGNQSGLSGEWRSPFPDSAFWAWTIIPKMPGVQTIFVRISGADMPPDANNNAVVRDVRSDEFKVTVIERSLTQRILEGSQFVTTSGPIALLLLVIQGIIALIKGVVEMIHRPDRPDRQKKKRRVR